MASNSCCDGSDAALWSRALSDRKGLVDGLVRDAAELDLGPDKASDLRVNR